MNKENLFLKIINETISDNSYLGNDCAYLEELNLLISQDTLVEDIHFKMDYFNPYELAKKALLVNISDILAGGGVPKYFTVALSGNIDESFIKNFYIGIDEISKKYNLKLIGGDLTAGDKITVSISILGDTKGRNISSRKNASVGDLVCIKGFHGSSAKGLELLLGGAKDKTNEFIKAHIEPVLYPDVSDFISKNAKNYVMMDTSDGLYDAMNRISIQSGVGFDISYEKIPKKTDDKNLVLFGGEDFGLFICIKPKDSFIIEKLNLVQIGTVTDTGKIVVDGVNIDFDGSFEHFK